MASKNPPQFAQSFFFLRSATPPETLEKTVSVRRFGDTAILTGVLITKSGKENSKEATMVVFVQSSGKWKIASAQWTPVAPTN
jgi:ketosteroid isomerase-like protein